MTREHRFFPIFSTKKKFWKLWLMDLYQMSLLFDRKHYHCTEFSWLVFSSSFAGHLTYGPSPHIHSAAVGTRDQLIVLRFSTLICGACRWSVGFNSKWTSHQRLMLEGTLAEHASPRSINSSMPPLITTMSCFHFNISYGFPCMHFPDCHSHPHFVCKAHFTLPSDYRSYSTPPSFLLLTWCYVWCVNQERVFGT